VVPVFPFIFQIVGGAILVALGCAVLAALGGVVLATLGGAVLDAPYVVPVLGVFSTIALNLSA
jgi:hypothetical protein